MSKLVYKHVSQKYGVEFAYYKNPINFLDKRMNYCIISPLSTCSLWIISIIIKLYFEINYLLKMYIIYV